MEPIIHDNIRALQQGINLISDISPVLYTYTDSKRFPSSIGSHIRHNVDHYKSLLQGYPKGNIDYDYRSRDKKIEVESSEAIVIMEQIIESIRDWDSTILAQPVNVKMDCGSTEVHPWSASTIYRELQFLLSHTIHHYALIGIICKLQGYEAPKEFGVAPSTLKYQSQNECVQ